MIEPTGAYPSPETQETTAKRQAIADFAYYAICQGQKEIGPIGYSPLPVNLVEAGFGQIDKLQQADPNVVLTNQNINTCDNPTFVEGQPNTNYLAEIAPLPPACDQSGAGPCAAGVTPNGIGATPTSSGSYPGSGAGAKLGSSTTTTVAGGGSNGANSQKGGSGGGSADGLGPPKLVTTDLPIYAASSWFAAWAPYAAGLLLIALAIPAVIGFRRARQRREVEL